MKHLPFTKYQGTGNDFIMINQLSGHTFLDGTETEVIQQLCDRRLGIGADGLILLQGATGYDFEMGYFNADGRRGSMCGNGARCAVAFARSLGLHQADYRFLAPDGPHRARASAGQEGWIEVEMVDVRAVEKGNGFFFLDTGSPHYVKFAKDLKAVDIETEGKKVRYSERFAEHGTNVNFASAGRDLPLFVSTYERGVEAETLSCGTGATAAAIAYSLQYGLPEGTPQAIPIMTKGGPLQVRLEQRGDHFCNIWLCGPAVEVFQGALYV